MLLQGQCLAGAPYAVQSEADIAAVQLCYREGSEVYAPWYRFWVKLPKRRSRTAPRAAPCTAPIMCPRCAGNTFQARPPHRKRPPAANCKTKQAPGLLAKRPGACVCRGGGGAQDVSPMGLRIDTFQIVRKPVLG